VANAVCHWLTGSIFDLTIPSPKGLVPDDGIAHDLRLSQMNRLSLATRVLLSLPRSEARELVAASERAKVGSYYALVNMDAVRGLVIDLLGMEATDYIDLDMLDPEVKMVVIRAICCAIKEYIELYRSPDRRNADNSERTSTFVTLVVRHIQRIKDEDALVKKRWLEMISRPTGE
jgi:hypothetical protein